MSTRPLISICIPAYKNVEYLKRLMESISIQTFADFEVIITNDGGDDSVGDYIKSINWKFSTCYHKNELPLGSPENWNASVNLAKGDWIKIMHHDDWFSNPTALQVFVQEIKNKPKCDFFFCDYKSINQNGETKKAAPANNLLRKLILKDTPALLASNVIGPPSVTIYRNDRNLVYDKKLKWLVDIDFYIRYLRNTKPSYINQSLISIGVHDEQVTKYSFLKPEIEIPEHLHVLNKFGEECLKNVLVYDAFWRLVRNLKIKTLQEFDTYNKDKIVVPGKIKEIIKHQSKLPAVLLAFGPSSKVAMLSSYFLNRGN